MTVQPNPSPAAPIVHNHIDTRRAHPELHQLAVFLHVVEAGSFTGAARRLGCSQPAVSQTISRLEDIYGGDLFTRRRGAPLALTPIGEAVLPSARWILDAIDRQIVDATNAAQSCGGTLSVGFCSGLFEGRFRVGISNFAAEAPLVRLRLIEGVPDMLRAALDRHRLDMIVSPLASMPNETEHESELLWNERLVATIPDKNSPVRREEIDLPALCAVPLLWPRYLGGSERSRVLGVDVIDGRKDPHHEVFPATVVDLVAMGLGTGIIPASAATPRPDVDFRPIEGNNAHIAIHASWYCDDANPLRHRLLRHLRAAASDA